MFERFGFLLVVSACVFLVDLDVVEVHARCVVSCSCSVEEVVSFMLLVFVVCVTCYGIGVFFPEAVSGGVLVKARFLHVILNVASGSVGDGDGDDDGSWGWR